MESPRKRRSLADQLRDDLKIETRIGQDIFSEEPVPLEVFLKDSQFMGQGVLSTHQFNLVRHMEQIYLPSMYPFMVENFGEIWSPVRYVNFLNVQWGKGSGKDFSVTMAVARIAYLLLCLNSPQDYYGIASQSDIHILNVAMNSAQARRAFFSPLSKALKRSPWFRDKLLSEITDKAHDISLHKQVELISGHSAVENFEGLSPIAVVLDEISGFQSESQKSARGIIESNRTAEAVYDIVRTSASTRFPESFKVAAISYPRYVNDPIQNLCNAALKDIEEYGIENSNVLVDGPRTTWEVNPRYDKYELISVPGTTTLIPNVDVFIKDYRNDPEMAQAKYECRPQRSSNRYFRNDGAINDAFPNMGDDFIEPLTINYYWGIDSEGAKAEESSELATVPGWQVSYDFSPYLKPVEGAIYALHADLAIRGDRAGICMAHVKNWERREHVIGNEKKKEIPNYQADDRPVVKIDFLTSYESEMSASEYIDVSAREIQIRWFRNLVRELKTRGFVIGLVTFDNFASQDSIQILASWGIESKVLSVDRNKMPYSNLKDVIYDGRLQAYYRERVITEISGLSELASGKIDHPPGGSKDEADALCGAVVDALALGGDEGEKPEYVDVDAVMDFEVYTPFTNAPNLWGKIDLTKSIWS